MCQSTVFFLLLVLLHFLVYGAGEDLCTVPSDVLIPHLENSHSLVIGNGVFFLPGAFKDCSGCVKELRICHAALSQPIPVTLTILNDNGTAVLVYNFTVFGTEDHDTNCEEDESFAFCCSNVTLNESDQFVVSSSDYFGVQCEWILVTYSPEFSVYFHIALSPGACGANFSSYHALINSTDNLVSQTTHESISLQIDTTKPLLFSPSLKASTSVIIIHYSTQVTPIALSEDNIRSTAVKVLVNTLPHQTSTCTDFSTSPLIEPMKSPLKPSEVSTALYPSLLVTQSTRSLPSPLLIGLSTGCGLVLLLLVVLTALLLLRTRWFHTGKQNRISGKEDEAAPGSNIDSLDHVLVNSNASYGLAAKNYGNSIASDASNPTIFSKTIATDSNPAYGSLSEKVDINPVYETVDDEMNKNLAYGSTSTDPTPIDTTNNPSYTATNPGPPNDEVYSYIPSEGEQLLSLASSLNIETSLNEAYTSLSRLTEEREEEEVTVDEGYVINSLVYEEAPDRPKPGEGDYVVNQLIYTVGGQEKL